MTAAGTGGTRPVPRTLAPHSCAALAASVLYSADREPHKSEVEPQGLIELCHGRRRCSGLGRLSPHLQEAEGRAFRVRDDREAAASEVTRRDQLASTELLRPGE